MQPSDLLSSKYFSERGIPLVASVADAMTVVGVEAGSMATVGGLPRRTGGSRAKLATNSLLCARNDETSYYIIFK